MVTASVVRAKNLRKVKPERISFCLPPEEQANHNYQKNQVCNNCYCRLNQKKSDPLVKEFADRSDNFFSCCRSTPNLLSACFISHFLCIFSHISIIWAQFLRKACHQSCHQARLQLLSSELIFSENFSTSPCCFLQDLTILTWLSMFHLVLGKFAVGLPSA